MIHQRHPLQDVGGRYGAGLGRPAAPHGRWSKRPGGQFLARLGGPAPAAQTAGAASLAGRRTTTRLPCHGAASRQARRSRLEAVLLLAREPLSLRKLARLANLADGTEARGLLGELRRCYDQRGSAFQVEQLAGGYQLLTRSKFAPWLRAVAPTGQEIRLSPPALETLVIVAYRQPVLRAEVEAIRGVQCGEILRQLMDRDLLRIAGRSEELGRPLMYGTTRRFLQAFGLCNLEQLPLADQLRRKAPIAMTDSLAGTSALPEADAASRGERAA
jgi:segregation and condensation protein B